MLPPHSICLLSQGNDGVHVGDRRRRTHFEISRSAPSICSKSWVGKLCRVKSLSLQAISRTALAEGAGMDSGRRFASEAQIGDRKIDSTAEARALWATVFENEERTSRFARPLLGASALRGCRLPAWCHRWDRCKAVPSRFVREG